MASWPSVFRVARKVSLRINHNIRVNEYLYKHYLISHFLDAPTNNKKCRRSGVYPWDRCCTHKHQQTKQSRIRTNSKRTYLRAVYMRAGTGRLPGRDVTRDPGMYMFPYYLHVPFI